MVDQLAQVALETLRDLLIDEARLLHGVSDQVEEIQRELSTIHCFLKDADASPDRYNSETVRNYVRDLKDLSLRAEDVLEKYAVEVTSKRRGRALKHKLRRYACILRECLSVHQTGKEIQFIRSQMANLTKKLESIPTTSTSADEAQQQQQQLLLRQTYAHEVEEHFVGMQKDIDHLVSLIKDDQTRSHRVISVCGMGGLGKTTLARKLYNHREVQSTFASRAWVCISQQFQPKNVLQQLLKQIIPGEKDLITNMEHNELVERLYDVQKQRKCFVVIDDIWETEHWDILRKAFPIAEANGKVLLTSRNENIASQEYVYKLGYLTEEQGWELLQKIALQDVYSQGEATELEAIGKEIVRKCGGLPLAISVMGGILRGKQTLSEWRKASNNIDTYLKHEGGANEKYGRVRHVLDLSYTVLPYYLKPCFLYLACFGEDAQVYTETLYQLWIAEGFVSAEDKGCNETLKDVAQRYLSELALRCMVEVKFYDPSDMIFSSRFTLCWLHDLMRDLCLSKCKEERFVEVKDLSQNRHHFNPASIGTTSRLVVHFGDDLPVDNFIRMEELKCLRSLHFLPRLGGDLDRMDISFKSVIFTHLNKMKSMRILTVEGCVFEDKRLLSEVGKLVHLKYLCLSKSDVGELPVSICYLPYLHTLDLTVLRSIILPNLIHKMNRLKHLFLRRWSVNGDELLILDGSKELETLALGDNGNSIRIQDLSKLTNLRLLQATFKGNEITSIIANDLLWLCEAHIVFDGCNFSHGQEDSALLRKMLMFDCFVSLGISGMIGCNLPRYQSGMCTNVVNLALANTKIEGVDVMKVVGKFPVLKALSLWGYVSVNSNILTCHALDFPQLRFLWLRRMPNLEKWEVEQGAMPNLSTIRIDHCNQLEMVPDGLRFLTTLEELRVEEMPQEFNDRLGVVNGEAGADYHKVSHIPFINFLR